MKTVSLKEDMGKYLKYTIIIDPQKFIKNGNQIDSFAELIGIDSPFTVIGNEVNNFNKPAFINFYFVKNVQKCITPNNIIDIQDDEIIKKLILPLFPTDYFLEETCKKFCESFYKNFEYIDNLVQTQSKYKSSIKEQDEDFKIIKSFLEHFLFTPNNVQNEEEFKTAFSEIKAEIKNHNFKGDEICAKIAENYKLVKTIQEIVFAFINHNDMQKYYNLINSINPIPAENEYYRRIYRPARLTHQIDILMLYIKNKLSFSYKVANEMLSPYADVISGLSIFNYGQESPFNTVFANNNTIEKYSINIIDLALETLLQYGKIDKSLIVNNKSSRSNGKCLFTTTEEYKNKFRETLLKNINAIDTTNNNANRGNNIIRNNNNGNGFKGESPNGNPNGLGS